MKKSILFFMLLLPGLLPAQQAEQFSGALLWKISGEDIREPSYILGTHHLAPVSFMDAIPGLKDAIAATSRVIGELDMSDPQAIQAQMQSAMMMPEGETYQRLLTKIEYAQLDEGLKSIMGVGLDQMGAFKPGMLSTLFTSVLYSRAHPSYNPMAHEAIDTRIQKIATEAGKLVIGLETPEDQLYALFNAEPLQVQAKQLACVVLNLDYQVKSLDDLNTAYREGDLNRLYNDTFNSPDDPCPSSQTTKDAMNKNRNDRWLVKLPALLAETPNLIAVGALHLAGPEGLLYRLAQMGYTVEPVE